MTCIERPSGLNFLASIKASDDILKAKSFEENPWRQEASFLVFLKVSFGSIKQSDTLIFVRDFPGFE